MKNNRKNAIHEAKVFEGHSDVGDAVKWHTAPQTSLGGRRG